ncbi:MAG TPA: hypothetical protein VNP96_02730 [Solirubrobacterales bacterium]|nr:hypothetical protein [Solirubrobacterales bacterium]
MTAWKLPLIVAAIAVPVVAAFMVGGPAVGTAAGALAALAILVVAARQRPHDPIGAAPTDEARRHVLVVAASPIEESGAVAAVAREARAGGPGEAVDVRVLAPASIGFLDRWASDVEGSRQRAQERLVATVAALAKAGIEAEARVGDEDAVQAVEDQLQSYPADEVILVTAGEDADGSDAAAAEELRSRLRPQFRHLTLGGR